jgi:hypothetical protein
MKKLFFGLGHNFRYKIFFITAPRVIEKRLLYCVKNLLENKISEDKLVSFDKKYDRQNFVFDKNF